MEENTKPRRLIICLPQKPRIMVTKVFTLQKIAQRIHDAFQITVTGRFIYRSRDAQEYIIFDNESLSEVIDMVKDSELEIYVQQKPQAESPEPEKKQKVEETKQQSEVIECEKYDEPEEVQPDNTPIVFCTHGMECILLTTKVAGPNQGRRFYRCPQDRNIPHGLESICTTFAWEDEVLALPTDLCYHGERCRLQQFEDEPGSKKGPWEWVCTLEKDPCHYRTKAKQLNTRE